MNYEKSAQEKKKSKYQKIPFMQLRPQNIRITDIYADGLVVSRRRRMLGNTTGQVIWLFIN